MKRNRHSAIEPPTGYPSVDSSMAWSAGADDSYAPPSYDGQPYHPESVLYSEQSAFFVEGSPQAAPYMEATAMGGYGDAPYGGPPTYPPLDDGSMQELDDDDSGSGGAKVLVVVVAILAAIILVIVGTNVYTVTSTRDDVHRVSTFYQQDADAVVVLGASVYEDGTPSDILADRLEVAADLYKAGAAREIIVSGDNTDEHYNESDAMRDYLIDLGVPEDKIVVDHLGTDTYSSIYRAKNAFGANRIIVVTQAYHLYRALMIAKGLGMNAGGVAADKGDYDDQTEYSVREILARTKDCLMTLAQVPVSTAHAE